MKKSLIKTYQYLHPDQTQLSFDIKTMEAIYDQHLGQPDTPHRHDYYTILLIKQASGKHVIDFVAYELQPSSVFFISPGQVHQLIEETQSYGYVINFSTQFLIQNNIRISFINDINLFKDYGANPPLILTENIGNQLFSLVESMRELLEDKIAFQYEALGAYLKLFLIYCNNICELNQEGNSQIAEAGTSILRNFKTLVEKYFKKQHLVHFYAEQLAVTPDHLNKTIKNLIHKTAKEYIQSRITTEAKRLLVHTNLTAKEISYDLGFNDPAHFSHFFKNCTGQTVSTFKSMYHL